MRKYFLFAALTILFFSACSERGVDYRNPKTPIDKRVENLISQMSLEEKIEQLQSQLLWPEEYEAKRKFTIGHVRNRAHFMHIGKKEAVSASLCAEAINEDTRRSIEASRLGIPVLQNGEALHGAQWGSATCFPQSIAMAAGFDDDFYYKVGQAVTKELRAVGVRQVYAPVINISRDPRWGRTEEGYGEDVFLNSRMGVSYVKALEEGGVIASPKHFVDNYGDGGHDSYASSRSWRDLREVWLEPFRACFVEGGARSVMAAYNTIDGVPCSSSEVLLTKILRDEWNFKGFAVSDYGGVGGVFYNHKIAEDYKEAQALCLEAGLDVEMPSGYAALPELIKSGRISEKTIDKSVRRVLTCKFELGLFENPYVDAPLADKIVRCPEHKALALEAARKIMTLLKNKNNALPLDKNKLKRVGLFGPTANLLSLGDYSGASEGWKETGVTPYDGLKESLKGKAEVVLHKAGTNAAALARTCDAVIFFASIREGEWSDRSRLELPKQTIDLSNIIEKEKVSADEKTISIDIDQEQMILDLAATGTKTIVVLQNGSPIDISRWEDKADAILEAWYSGEQGGTAIAEVLLGDVNPGGRLPITFPRHVGQVPVYYSIKPSGRGYSYNDDDGKPMYPFGYGLTYTTFEYSNLILPEKITKGNDAEIQVTVKNTGNRTGDEVIQLYMNRKQAPVALPMTELKAFRRITLQPGESRQVTLSLPARSFGFWDKHLNFTIEPGLFYVNICKDAVTPLLKGEITLE